MGWESLPVENEWLYLEWLRNNKAHVELQD